MLLDAIGNTPMVRIDNINVKLEHLNPSGSVKDRIANYIVQKAEQAGQLKKGYTIVEATSGNTGIAFSLVAAQKGYKMTVVMPKGMSEERTEIMKAFGAKLIFVHKECVRCAVLKAEEIAKKKKYYMPRQFENKWNIDENRTVLGKEILKQAGPIDAFVAGVGTGGTVIGVGQAIKKKFPQAKIIAVEPAECALLSGSGYNHHRIYGFHKKVCEHHRIEGIGDGFIPKIVESNRKVIDDVITVSSPAAIAEMHRLAGKGYFVGPSSGANMLAAKQLKKKYKNIVTLFPDRGDRYLSELY